MSTSLAGSWGETQLKKMNLSAPIFGVTTNKEMFGDQHIKKHKEDAQTPLAKFKQMKESETMILTYANPGVHSQHSQAWGKHELEEESASTSASQNSLKMSRTTKRVLREGDAPVAIGRSGARVEVGINASGLLGERLLLSNEPSRNTVVQRAWLPYDDPALLYKMNGVPEAFMPNDVSLNLGPNGGVKPGWVHGREAIFTGGPLSKVGARRAGVYMDEFRADGSRIPINP